MYENFPRDYLCQVPVIQLVPFPGRFLFAFPRHVIRGSSSHVKHNGTCNGTTNGATLFTRFEHVHPRLDANNGEYGITYDKREPNWYESKYQRMSEDVGHVARRGNARKRQKESKHEKFKATLKHLIDWN